MVRTDFYGDSTPTTLASSSDADSVPAPTSSLPTAVPNSKAESIATPEVSATAATPLPVFSVYYPSSDASPSPAPLTTGDVASTSADTTSAPPTSVEPSMAPTPAADDRIANKGKQGGNSGAASNNAAAGGFGIDYELIGSAGCKQQKELNDEFGFLSTQGYSKLRFYDIGCDLSVATAAAAAAGFSVTLGLNTINNVAGDLGTLIGFIKGNWGPVDTVVIGNEVVNSQGGSPAALANAVNTGRGILQAAGFTKSVVAVDTYMAHQNHPEICQASDYCAVNAHAFFDANNQASDAGSFVKNAISQIQTNGKSIIVTESGWPYAGSSNVAAIPSPANQQAAIASLKQAFAGNPGGLFLFQAYDATYKDAGQFGVERYFGIYGH